MQRSSVNFFEHVLGAVVPRDTVAGGLDFVAPCRLAVIVEVTLLFDPVILQSAPAIQEEVAVSISDDLRDSGPAPGFGLLVYADDRAANRIHIGANHVQITERFRAVHQSVKRPARDAASAGV